uniref:exodeoxyribonuclease III n=1 Tax=Seriola dumerili TaxID=41447 RepID=A0A3B4UAP0_SERDU
MGLSLITLNTKGLNQPAKRRKCMSFLKSKNCDVAFLQETHMKDQEHRRLGTGWVGKVYASSGTSNSRGVAIIVNKHLPFKCIKKSADTLGRFISVLAEIQGQTVILACVYAPCVYDPDFFPSVENALYELGTFPIVMAGDFNQHFGWITLEETGVDQMTLKLSKSFKRENLISLSYKITLRHFCCFGSVGLDLAYKNIRLCM